MPILLTLLPELMQSVQTMAMMPEVRLDIITCLLSIFHLAKPEQLQSYIQNIESDEMRSVSDI
jgi:hypothetical protein